MHVAVKEDVYEVFRADLDRDREAILALWARNLSSSDDSGRTSRFAWQYQTNIAGAGRCWLLVHRPSGQTVGTAGLALRDISCEGRSLKAGLAIDFAVDEPHRFLQPALILQRSVLESLSGGVDFIYGLPNTKALPIFKRLGYQGPSHLLRMVKVLKTSSYLDRFPAPVRGLVGLGGDLLHRARSAETWMTGRGRSVAQVFSVGGEFDDLWQRLARRFPMICRRNSDFVRWRFERFPMVRYTVLGLWRENKTKLDGYAVIHIEENGQARITDFIADGKNASDDLLVGLIRWARANEATSMAFEFGGDPQLEARLKDFGFVNRSSTAMLMSYFADTSLQKRSADLLQRWRFSAGDMAYL